MLSPQSTITTSSTQNEQWAELVSLVRVGDVTSLLEKILGPDSVVSDRKAFDEVLQLTLDEFDENAIHQNLVENGYKPFQYDPIHRVLIPLAGPHEHNTIYISDVEFVQKRVSTARKIKVQDQEF
jgi:hypothetical protein